MDQPLSQIGPYTIEREVGRGGMGVVYLGRDTKLDRAVAIKSLPDHLAEDPDRLARFEREARTLAQLSHSNVAGIYGLEESEGRRYLVLEYVEGETLAERLDRGALPVDDAIEVCIQVAAGVEAAHEAGVIHRDLKPANIKITPSGQVKVLDFGLAKVEEGTSAGSLVYTQSPTRTTPGPQHSPTMSGMIMGTAPYMSPEQARGRSLDRRTDTWSFGIILYECLTGAGPFAGETATDSIGAILHKDVDMTRLPAGTPANARHVLARCLQRDRNLRYRDIGDARLDLVSGGATPVMEEAPGARGRSLLWIAALVAGLLIGGAAVWLAMQSRDPGESAGPGKAEVRRYSINLPESAPVAPPSAYPFGAARRMLDLSPDGNQLVYSALVNDRLHLHIRDMSTGEVEPVRGGEGGFAASFSRDGEQLAFFVEESMYLLDLERRTDPEFIADAPSPGVAAWAEDGTIYFVPSEHSPVVSLRPGDGKSSPTPVSVKQGDYQPNVTLSADSETVIFTSARQTSDLYSVPVGSPEDQSLLLASGSDPRVYPDDRLLFLRGNRLMAVLIDPSAIALAGDPVTILSDVRSGWGVGQYAFSGNGTMVYARGASDMLARFVWLDRSGSKEEIELELEEYLAFALAPDGRRLATPIVSGGDIDIWLFDLDRPQAPSRITFGGAHNWASWSDDGRYLFYGGYVDGVGIRIWVKDTATGAAPFVVEGAPDSAFPLGYNDPANDLLFMADLGEGNGPDLLRGTVDLSHGPGATLSDMQPIAATPNNEPFAAISPDRKWIVANSNETGRWELYLSSYPDGAGRIQISTTGGEEPRWRDDGSRVVYRWNDAWFEVDVTAAPRLQVSQPRVITRGPYINVGGYSWDMTGDGRRLLLLEGPQQDTPFMELHVITGLSGELDRLLGEE